MAILRMKRAIRPGRSWLSNHRRRPWHGPDDERQATIGQALAGRQALSDPRDRGDELVPVDGRTRR